MNFKNIFIALSASSVLLTGCIEDFAEVNTNPSVVADADIRFLFTQALNKMDNGMYEQWFYNNNQCMMPWAQFTTSSGGNVSTFNEHGNLAGQNGALLWNDRVLSATEEIIYLVDNVYTGEKQESYQSIKVLCNPIKVYLGLMATDMDGSFPYSEAYKARYTNPPLLTPKYDTQAELFDLWLKELDATLDVLSKQHSITQVSLGTQDFVYGGDYSKWKKFANSLKLKIAVRMLHRDKARALKIAEEVVASPAGLVSSVSDDFVWNPGSQYYHFYDDVTYGSGSKQLVDFLVNNKDPRVRFIFQKNDFNSKVVQAFFDAKAANPKSPDLPFYIAEKVDYTVDANGKKVFTGWKAPGEPWVRYYGAPISVHSKDTVATNDAYFNTNMFKISLNGKQKTYVPLAIYNQEVIVGEEQYTFPDAPDAPVQYDNLKSAWFGLYFSAAEVYFYLTELKLLGANIGSADDYFEKAVTASVEAFDKHARLCNIPYYSSVYDKEHEKVIALQSNEISELLGKEAYKLTGSIAEKLEKVYIQQYVNFAMLPTDMYVTARRSGVPMKGSKYLPWMSFANMDFPIPRRFLFGAPDASDLMYNNIVTAGKEQNFTMGSRQPEVLSKERVWYDQGAPEFGAGPNY